MSHPTYQFVTNLLDHDLLHLDPDLSKPARADSPAGPHRTGLFAAAGLIEVTTESTRDWDREVLAGHERLLVQHKASPLPLPPRWQQLMRKLVDFRTQGDRTSIVRIATQARLTTEDDTLFAGERLKDLLTDSGTPVPTEKERLALYRVLDLANDQIRYLEDGIEAGRIPLRRYCQVTPFSRLFDEILARLAAAGISADRLTRMTKAQPTERQGIESSSVISHWRHGKATPTLVSLRHLAGALRRCGKAGHRLVSDQEIEALVQAAGFTSEDLAATCHDVIARITEQTRIGPLLSAIRNASDVSAPLSAVTIMDRSVPPRFIKLPSESRITQWECESRDCYPTKEQVRELLDRYNLILKEKGHDLMTDREIDQVIAVADRDCKRRQELPREVRRNQQAPTRRLPPSPLFDDGPGR